MATALSKSRSTSGLWASKGHQATAQTGYGAQGLFRLGVTSLLEDEDRQPQKAELAGKLGEPRRFFFHGIANQDQGIHLTLLTFLQSMFQDAPDLRQTRRARDAGHAPEQFLGLVTPG